MQKSKLAARYVLALILIKRTKAALTFLQHANFKTFHETAGLARLASPFGDLTFVGGRTAVLNVPWKASGETSARQNPQQEFALKRDGEEGKAKRTWDGERENNKDTSAVRVLAHERTCAKVTPWGAPEGEDGLAAF